MITLCYVIAIFLNTDIDKCLLCDQGAQDALSTQQHGWICVCVYMYTHICDLGEKKHHLTH